MNAPFDAASLAMSKFAIGQPVSRKEDPVLLRGQGRYTADIDLPGQAYAVMVRSRIASGIIHGIDTEAARAMPGVLAVFTATDLQAAGIGSLPSGLPWKSRDGSDMHRPPQFPLAVDRVRFLGEPVAAVIAETLQQARDAAEAVLPDIDATQAVSSIEAAIAEGAPLVHNSVPGNIPYDFHFGDTAKVDAAFAGAAHVVRLSVRNNRIVVCAMEPRAAVGAWEDGRYVLRVGCQGAFGLRDSVRSVLSVERKDLRILSGNVGGSFGMKAGSYPEYFPLLLGARQLGRPVKWVDERTESFLSDAAGRDHMMDVALALDADGKFLAVRVQGYGNLGAYHANFGAVPATLNAVKNITSVYTTEAIEISTKLVFTNATPVGPYRGAGRPEGNYYMERLIDTAAREMGIDRVELRRRNHIKTFPYATPGDTHYDSGDFSGVLDQALEEADWDGFEARRAESAARGRLRGRGIGQYLEVTAPPMNEMGGIRFDADGGVTIITGTLDYGQGHASPFAQVLTTKLGVPFDRIRLLQGDSDELVAGGGTGGSKSIMASGGAIIEASELVIEKGRKIAAHLLEAAEVDIEFEAGVFRIAGTDRAIGVMELAERLRAGITLPDGVPDSLDVAHIHKGAPSAYPNGCHIAEVEVDPDTGVAEVVRYTMVNDFGVVVNPMLVAGQAHGGVVQGIGQALLEQTHFDADGQVLSGSFMDYALPRAGDAPPFAVGSHPVPATTNLLGAKGCGEAGCAGALPSVMNALVDALAERGITHIDMPATPQRIWAALQGAGSR
jgi:aerobic carbon-monoxide dehydrogenase large subunit